MLSKAALIAALLIALSYGVAVAAPRYVDALPAESGSDWDGTDGHSYTGSPGAGTGYATIQAAVTAASAGDVIYMRGGTIDCSETTGEGSVTLYGKSGTSWSAGAYFTLTSYPGEWAVIDGGRDIAIGNIIHGYQTSIAYGMAGNAVSYWLFERFEIKNSGYSGESTSSAFWLGLGPFKFRYLYIHDNYSDTYVDNSGGVSLFESNGSIFEYCVFDNNGSNSATSHNNSHIEYYVDQTEENIVAENGFTTQDGTRNNIVRYCLFKSTSLSGDAFRTVGIKDKGAQFLTGRNPEGGHGWSDTLIEQGHKIHHNIFLDIGREAVFIESDFAQVWQNIIHVTTVGGPPIAFQYYVSGRPLSINALHGITQS